MGGNAAVYSLSSGHFGVFFTGPQILVVNIDKSCSARSLVIRTADRSGALLHFQSKLAGAGRLALLACRSFVSGYDIAIARMVPR
jgi:hypothetical protein